MMAVFEIFLGVIGLLTFSGGAGGVVEGIKDRKWGALLASLLIAIFGICLIAMSFSLRRF